MRLVNTNDTARGAHSRATIHRASEYDAAEERGVIHGTVVKGDAPV